MPEHPESMGGTIKKRRQVLAFRPQNNSPRVLETGRSRTVMPMQAADALHSRQARLPRQTGATQVETAVPLAKRRSLDARAGDLMAAPIVIVQIEVVLQGIGSDHVIAAFGETEDDSGGGVLVSRDWFEPHRNIDIGIRPAGRDDDVERIVFRPLNQRLASRSARNVFDAPFSSYGLPALEWPGEVEPNLRPFSPEASFSNRHGYPQSCSSGYDFSPR
jgi:hypothetical protein